MNNLNDLALRIAAEDPELTADALEKIIADHIGKLVNGLFEEIETHPDIALLRAAIQKRFGYECQIMPEMALYVNIGDSSDKPPIIPFSSRALEQALRQILEKDFSATKPEHIMQLLRNTITNSCHHFLQAIVFSNAEFLKLTKTFAETFGMELTFFPKSPIMLAASRISVDEDNSLLPYGQYL